MSYYRRVGNVPPKRHTQHRAPSGALYYEELVGEDGFSAESSLMYHRGIPSAITGAVDWEIPDVGVVANAPLLPRHLRPHELIEGEEWKRHDLVTGRRLLLGNADLQIYYAAAGEVSPLYRDACGDELVYVESGHGVLESTMGSMEVATGDYVVIPRSVTHRWIPDSAEPLRTLIIEAGSHIRPPRRYLSPRGQFLEHAPYCERDLRAPAEVLLREGENVEVFVKHRSPSGTSGTTYVCAHHPFDVVGWDGCLYPYAFNISDFEPITGRIHQPPPVHQVFEGDGFVVCNFVPRKVDYHPLSVPVPYYHSNVDSDEVLFYCGGDYTARAGSGIAQGSLSLHPGGHTHGPQPGAVERSLGRDSFDELAAMIDTFRPLSLGAAAGTVEDEAYAWTWSSR